MNSVCTKENPYNPSDETWKCIVYHPSAEVTKENTLKCLHCGMECNLKFDYELDKL